MSKTRLITELSPNSGARKRRNRLVSHTTHSTCHCGLKLRTRRGVSRCPVHGQSWSPFYVGKPHWPDISE